MDSKGKMSLFQHLNETTHIAEILRGIATAENGKAI